LQARIPTRTYSSDFKEIKSEKKIDPELEEMIKSDQSNLATEEMEKDVKKPEEVNVLIPENETPVGESITKEFQAETKKILDIVARSLYSDKEIFIRGMRISQDSSFFVLIC
jgi:hypothetical protein